jgi:PadR family transcriptional regulator, regulatory protein AphA
MPLEHAIIAFLEFKPMSGYDLKKFFDLSVAHFWSSTQSHIYKALEGLGKKGWVQAQVIPQEGKPNRKEYQVTAEGRSELRRWLVTPLPMDPVRKPLLIQIFFSHFSTNKEIAALLEVRMEETRSHLQALRTLVQAGLDENADRIGVERSRQLWQMTLDYGIDYYEFELSWYEKAMKRIHNLPHLTPPIQ